MTRKPFQRNPVAYEDAAAAQEALRERRKGYQLVFGTPAGQAVLEDLAEFCRADTTCFDPDPRIHAALEGRREVWLRIQQHLNLSSDQLVQLFSGRALKPQDNSNG